GRLSLPQQSSSLEKYDEDLSHNDVGSVVWSAGRGGRPDGGRIGGGGRVRRPLSLGELSQPGGLPHPIHASALRLLRHAVRSCCVLLHTNVPLHANLVRTRLPSPLVIGREKSRGGN